jgi:putative transcriptional regulator
MNSNQQLPEKGKVMLSEPFLQDSLFQRSVVLLAENTEKGAMGFILNKPVGYKINELVQEFPEFDSPVYFGGPVDSNSLFFIHTVPHLIESAFEIADGIHYGGNYEKLTQMASIGLIQPDQVRFFAGYSGWDSGQLNFEMEEDSWLVFDRPEKLLLMQPENLWRDILKQSKSKHAIWSNYPENPRLN